MRNLMIATLVSATAAASAGLVSPFTETFDDGNANWHDGPQNPATWNSAGYIETTADLNTASPFGLLIFRAQNNFGSSDGAFEGDYIASGINSLSLDIRHDAGQDVSFAVRFATANNSPAFVLFNPVMVSSGVWTTLTFAIDPDSPFYAPAGGTFQDVASQIGNLQIIANRPDGLATPLVTTFDLDNVSIVPAPGALALLGLGGLAGVRRRR